MEYFMVPAQKVPSLQHFRKTEKEVIGGLCRYVRAPLINVHTYVCVSLIARQQQLRYYESNMHA